MRKIMTEVRNNIHECKTDILGRQGQIFDVRSEVSVTVSKNGSQMKKLYRHQVIEVVRLE